MTTAEPLGDEHFYPLPQKLGARILKYPLGLSIHQDDLARSVNHHYGIRGGLDDKPKAPLGTEFRSYGPHVFVAIPIEIYAAHLASSDPDPAVDCDRARHSIVGLDQAELADAALLASLADETPEGRSIVVLAREKYGLRARETTPLNARFVPFSAETRMSGIDVEGVLIRKGAIETVIEFAEGGPSERLWHDAAGGAHTALRAVSVSDAVRQTITIAERISREGGTPLAVAKDNRLLGVIHLKDIVKGGIRERCAELRRMGIRTVMITGDNPLTAAAIAAESGVDDFLAQATPETKLALILDEQAKGKLVAMCGDGTNDAPALAQADVGVAMNTGTMAARDAANMVDLDSDPTKLIEIVAIGKQLLMTRGALTTFSIANDVAKYFAIIPAIFATFYPQLGVLNVMRLETPESAILSAIIFNAVIIIALIPLSLRGVAYRPAGAAPLLRRNLLIYGIGGMIVPFIGIKLIDMVVTAVGLA
jgi:K+-transporting ATPase ATPase B chain